MGVATAFRKGSWDKVKVGVHLSPPWKGDQVRARAWRIFGVAGLIAGIGAIAALLWVKWCREED